jgi:hypothetical protein
LRDELRQQRQGEFFSAYMMKAREKMALTYNQAVLQQILTGK